MTDPKADELRKQVQADIVRIVTSKLQKGLINEARAKEIAQLVLEKLPEGMSYQKLIEIIPTLDDHFDELTAAVVPIMMEYERKMHDIVNAKVAQLIKDGKLDEALSMTQKAIEFDRQLS
jgi:hypothetical protein